MFSFIETFVILVVAVIVFGPKRLPEMARKIGRWSGMLRRASDEFKRQIMTMDQAVDDTLNRATGNLDALVPTDEELGQAMDFGAEPELPDVPLDETGGDWPASGEAEAPAAGAAETPAAPAAEVAPPPPAPAARQPHRARRAAEPTAPRSLGLSPTRKEAHRG